MSILDQIFSLTNSLATLNSYFSQLQPASFNDRPFFTRGSSTVVGRRLAEHIYPFRDDPWMEDLGRKARRYHIIGFLVGDDVISQRDRMQSELEGFGSGILVHPTYGRLNVSATDQCTFEEDVSHGRVIEMRLVFQESGLRIWPSIDSSTGQGILDSADAADAAASDDFTSQIGTALKSGAQAASQALKTASVWTGQLQTLGNDATNIFHLSANLVGPFGRFFGGSTGSGSGSISGKYASPSQVASQVANLVNTASADRSSLAAAASSVQNIFGGL